MSLHNLIFSDQKGYKISRHLVFWAARFLFVIVNKLINNYSMGNGITPWENLTELSMVLGVKVGLEAAFCYAGIYWLLPKYLVKEKYVAFGIWLVSLSILDVILFATFFPWFLGTFNLEAVLEFTWQFAFQFFMSGGFPVCILLIAYKMMKTWYQKEEEKTALTIGNTNAELLLLKAQVHPHFLFNTLNNIYSFTLDKSPMAGELVAKLSHILRYMTKECEEAQVPVVNEIKILTDYIVLEKVRYGSRLDLQVEITGNQENKAIAPLLMIPFVENAFKHGASKMLEYPWIKLSITIEDSQLIFSLTNSKPLSSPATNGKNGLGLKNVRRRLQLLYPTSHALVINSLSDYFSVEMVVALGRIPNAQEVSHLKTKTLTHIPSYAGI
jgi:sensor histidine kinase YesM